MTTKHIRNEHMILVKKLEEHTDVQKCPYRMDYHIMPKVGWLNDPNGLCQFHGIYHVFFQYTPQNVHGGGGYWGHAISKDLLHWQYLEPALTNDTLYDRDGVYSGSALIEGDTMSLFYTGTYKELGPYDYTDHGRISTQLLVTSRDGRHFNKKIPLLSNENYPSDMTLHIRDPKVWKVDQYYMILGARKRDNHEERKDIGGVLIYTSKDKEHWSLAQEIFPQKRFGYMWECPDLFQLDQKTILSYCPQGLPHYHDHFQNVYQSGYSFLDKKIGEKNFYEWDMGFDFYAPQTFLDDHHRRILVGWAGMPDDPNITNLSIAYGWQHCLTLPRELYVHDHRIHQRPIKEWCEMNWQVFKQSHKYNWRDHTVFLTADHLNGQGVIIIGIYHNALTITFDEQNIIMDFKKSHCGGGRGVRIGKVQDKIQSMELCIDSSIVELFVNEGECVMTTRLYLEKEERWLSHNIKEYTMKGLKRINDEYYRK